MKLYPLLFSLGESLTCFTCSGSSYNHCISNGRNVQCRKDSVCKIDMRKRDGIVLQLSMGNE